MILINANIFFLSKNLTRTLNTVEKILRIPFKKNLEIYDSRSFVV